MKKKLIWILMALVMALCAFGLSSCDEELDEDEDEFDWADFYGDDLDDESVYYTPTYTNGAFQFEPHKGVNKINGAEGNVKNSQVAINEGGHLACFSVPCVEYVVEAKYDCTVLVLMSIATSGTEFEGPRPATETFSLSYTHEADLDADGIPVRHELDLSAVDDVTSTGDWFAYVEYTLGEISLKTGKTTITVSPQSTFSVFNVGYVALAPKESEIQRPLISYDGGEQTYKLCETNSKILGSCKFEECQGLQGLIIGNAGPGTSIEMIITAASECQVSLVLNAAFGVDSYDSNLLIDRVYAEANRKEVIKDEEATVVTKEGQWWTSDNYKDVTLGTITLKQGENKILVEMGSDNCNFNTITLRPVQNG